MTYQVLADDGSPLDAHFDIEADALIFHSRGGTKGKNATNIDYARALRLLAQRLAMSGHAIQRAWVDSRRVQAIPIKDRLILDDADARLSPTEQVSRMSTRMQAIGRDPSANSDHGNSTKRIRLQLSKLLEPAAVLLHLQAIPAKKDFRSSYRLAASELNKVTPEHLFNAVERLLSATTDHPFEASTDYDVLLEDGSRLPPKAVVGLAASQALGHEVGPRHLAAGLKSTCFRILENAGYQIVPKSETSGIEATVDYSDAEWSEGHKKLRSHLQRERKPTVRPAKIAQFRSAHAGRLFCERCGEDPIQKYQTEQAEACIEVHHAAVHLSQMQEGHRTRLEELQCLCANCHRLTHREMRIRRASAKLAADRLSPIV